MHTLDLLEQAIETAKCLGYKIRQEWLDGQQGGLCEIAGTKWIFVDLSLNSMEKLDQVLDALGQDNALETATLPTDLDKIVHPKRRAA
ncbi:MAG: hypothetical protein ACKVH8_06650 [Pirellulales bacterium]